MDDNYTNKFAFSRNILGMCKVFKALDLHLDDNSEPTIQLIDELELAWIDHVIRESLLRQSGD